MTMATSGAAYHRGDRQRHPVSLAVDLERLHLHFLDESKRLCEESKRLAQEAKDAVKSAEACRRWRHNLGGAEQ